MSMSKADEFRQSTAEFWSKMDQKVGSGAARRKLTPARSGKTAAGSMPRARAVATVMAAGFVATPRGLRLRG